MPIPRSVADGAIALATAALALHAPHARADGPVVLAPDRQLFARVENLLDKTWQNFGILGANYFRGPGNTFDPGLAGPEQFRSPGAPIGAWIGIRYRLDRGAGNR